MGVFHLRRCAAAVAAAFIVFFLFPLTIRAQYAGEITSANAIMVDASTGAVLFEKNSRAKAYPVMADDATVPMTRRPTTTNEFRKKVPKLTRVAPFQPVM